MFRYITHPFATRHQGCPRAAVRLACVKHAASVQSEPGSNSSVQSSNFLSVLADQQISLKANLLSYLRLCEVLLYVLSRSHQPKQVISAPVQVPTLIGCFFYLLKNFLPLFLAASAAKRCAL